SLEDLANNLEARLLVSVANGESMADPSQADGIRLLVGDFADRYPTLTAILRNVEQTLSNLDLRDAAIDAQAPERRASRAGLIATPPVLPPCERWYGPCRTGLSETRLLPRKPQIVGHPGLGGTPGVDVQPATTQIACMDAQLATLTEQPLQVQKDPLHALLVEVAVLTEGNQILQQAGPVDRRAAVTDHYAGPVGLPGDRAVGFEQVAVEGLAHLARARQQPQEA